MGVFINFHGRINIFEKNKFKDNIKLIFAGVDPKNTHVCTGKKKEHQNNTLRNTEVNTKLLKADISCVYLHLAC